MGARSMTKRLPVEYDQGEMADEELTEAISLRLSKDDMELLKELAARMPIKKLTIARAAMRLGLAEIAKNPAALFQASVPAAPKSEPKPKKR